MPAPETARLGKEAQFLPKTGWPVADLQNFLAGSWSLARKMRDLRHQIEGHLDGEARFTPQGSVLLYEERGHLVFGDHQGQAVQSYRFEFPLSCARADVYFRDGRFFHALDLTRGQDRPVHLCGADRYDGDFTARDENTWGSNWQVVGPRKDLLITTLYRRQG